MGCKRKQTYSSIRQVKIKKKRLRINFKIIHAYFKYEVLFRDYQKIETNFGKGISKLS